VFTIVRFNFVLPEPDAKVRSAMYQAGTEMAQYADENGFVAVSFEEHHGAENGWSPSPLITAGMVLASTKNIRVSVRALLVPLHDPLRLAEDIAVLDLYAPGRVAVVAGLGYRPDEYAAHGRDWAGRGALMDESLEAILNAWKGEPFTYQGRTVMVRPTPISPPAQILSVGGSSKAAARRAARLGLPFEPAASLPELEPYYRDRCEEYGTSGYVLAPAPDLSITFFDRDPDRAWEEIGPCLLHEVQTYASWQTADVHSAVYSPAKTVEELRAGGVYEIVTPEQFVERARDHTGLPVCVMHPLCGGIPIDRAWEGLRLYVDEVLPALT